MYSTQVNYVSPSGSFPIFCKDKALVNGRNVTEILPAILETKEFCLNAQNMVKTTGRFNFKTDHNYVSCVNDTSFSGTLAASQ
jgi:hypothetical protein